VFISQEYNVKYDAVYEQPPDHQPIDRWINRWINQSIMNHTVAVVILSSTMQSAGPANATGLHQTSLARSLGGWSRPIFHLTVRTRVDQLQICKFWHLVSKCSEKSAAFGARARIYHVRLLTNNSPDGEISFDLRPPHPKILNDYCKSWPTFGETCNGLVAQIFDKHDYIIYSHFRHCNETLINNISKHVFCS